MGAPPSTLVDVVRFLVYIKTEEHFLLQLNQKCLLPTHCAENDDKPELEL